MLYGWIEVGASNNALFSSEQNEDLILRTVYDTNKLIVGNTAGTNIPAALYVQGNNLGVRRVPASNVQLDVAGTARFQNLLIGHSNLVSTTTVNGPYIWKDTAATYSNADNELGLTNSNAVTSFTYNGSARLQITDGQGLFLNDDVYVQGDVFANAFQTTCDQRAKHAVRPSCPAGDTATLRALNVYDYKLNASPTQYIKGFIAQEVEAVLAQAVQKRRGILYFPGGGVRAELLQGRAEGGHFWVAGGTDLGITAGDDVIVQERVRDSTTQKIFTVNACQPASTIPNAIVVHIRNLVIPEPSELTEYTLIGRIIPDMYTLDLHQITALNTSVLQSVLSRLDAIEARIP